jgi:hypothetical protein
MPKPTQTRMTFDNDAVDLSAALEDAMNSIASAMEALQGFGDFSDWFDALGDIYDEMQPDCENYENICAAEYAEEIRGLTRDYYRSVL